METTLYFHGSALRGLECCGITLLKPNWQVTLVDEEKTYLA